MFYFSHAQFIVFKLFGEMTVHIGLDASPSVDDVREWIYDRMEEDDFETMTVKQLM